VGPDEGVRAEAELAPTMPSAEEAGCRREATDEGVRAEAELAPTMPSAEEAGCRRHQSR